MLENKRKLTCPWHKLRYGAPIAIAICPLRTGTALPNRIFVRKWWLDFIPKPIFGCLYGGVAIWRLANCCFRWLSSQDCWLPTAPGWENQRMRQGMCESTKRLGVAAANNQQYPRNHRWNHEIPQEWEKTHENSTSAAKSGDWLGVSICNPFLKEDLERPWFSPEMLQLWQGYTTGAAPTIRKMLEVMAVRCQSPRCAGWSLGLPRDVVPFGYD